MPPTLLSCGSNAASHLAINHPNDVSVLTPTIYHHSLPPIFPSARILEVISASAHSLLLLSSLNSSSLDDGQDKECRNILLGAGTNTLGQLGPRCSLWDDMIKGGQRHVIVVITGLECQRVMGWGASRKGELSAATLSSVTAAGPSNKAKGKSKANSHPLTSPPTLIDLPLQRGQNVIDIALGASHTIALLSDGSVLGWGSNLKGQITGVHELENVRAIAATWGGSYFLTSDGIYSQGSNTHSQLLRGQTSSERSKVNMPEGKQVEKIVAGTEHLLVLARAGGQEEILFAGGWNEHGNLAMGDERDRDALERIELKGKVLGLWGGCASTWVWVDA
ncbi:hypothetical protein I310_04581 [Cryptococcus deuterogattii CA1014]|nr:hypothetical protein I310_04581 [Cryptococcus deuterogattii CA1014]